MRSRVYLLYLVGAAIVGLGSGKHAKGIDSKMADLAMAGETHHARGQTSKAIHLFKQALNMSNKSNDPIAHRTWFLNGLAFAYSDFTPPASRAGLKEVSKMYAAHLAAIRLKLDRQTAIRDAIITNKEATAERTPIDVETELILIDAVWSAQRVVAMESANAGE